MPRLSDHDYLQNHEQLRVNRHADNAAFVMLTSGEQWDLFRYYLPHESRSQVELLTHRDEISTLDPSLPQRAGRALHKLMKLKKLLPEYRQWKASQARVKKNAEKQVVIFAQVKPELDAQEFARIILRMSK